MSLLDITSGHWLLTADYYSTLLKVSQRLESNPSKAAELRAECERRIKATVDATDTIEGTDLRIKDGVAIQIIAGPIFPRITAINSLSGRPATIERLSHDLSVALEHPDVKSILLYIDSPGGYVTGVNDYAEKLYQARQQKPLHAYVMGAGYSAAYWLASAAETITLDATAGVGSVGVLSIYTDATKQEKKLGLHKYITTNSQSPNKSAKPSTDEGKANLIKELDAIAQVFFNAVARNRGISVEQIAAWKGETRIGQDAIDAGMADHLGSFDQLIQTHTQGQLMSKNTDGTTAEKTLDLQSLQNQHPDIYQAVVEQATQAALSTERQRCADILDTVAATSERQKLAFEAIAKGQAAGEYALALAKAEKEPPSNSSASANAGATFNEGFAVTPAPIVGTEANKSNAYDAESFAARHNL